MSWRLYLKQKGEWQKTSILLGSCFSLSGISLSNESGFGFLYFFILAILLIGLGAWATEQVCKTGVILFFIANVVVGMALYIYIGHSVGWS